MTKYIIALLFVSVAGVNAANAQWESIIHEGEIGITAGAAHYFGDLNTRARLNRGIERTIY